MDFGTDPKKIRVKKLKLLTDKSLWRECREATGRIRRIEEVIATLHL
jgi:hypothetical protein